MNNRRIMFIIICLLLFLSLYSAAIKKDIYDRDWHNTIGMDSIVIANNRFTMDVYDKIKQEEGNILFSPYSIFVSFNMLYEGARGNTAKEISKVIYALKNSDIRRNCFRKMINALNYSNDNCTIKTANALWIQEEYRIHKNYINIIENYYYGKARNLDFVNNTEECREIINKWVETQTREKIKNLLPKGSINSLTRLVLTNAIYFKSSWLIPFDKKNTYTDKFIDSNRDTSDIEMMINSEMEIPYYETNEFQAIELFYSNKNFSMIIILPKENKFNTFEKELNNNKLNEIVNNLKITTVNVYLPKFKMEKEYPLNNIMQQLGIISAFNAPPADFSGIDGTKNLKIQSAVHKSFIEITEEGTEAAAATGIVEGIESIKMSEIFKANRPFFFIIREKNTNLIIFFGRVSKL